MIVSTMLETSSLNGLNQWYMYVRVSEIKKIITSLTQQYLLSYHSTLQKAVSYLSCRIDK